MPGAGLENIKKAGICKIDDLEEIKEFQSFYTEVEDVKKLLKHNLKDQEGSKWHILIDLQMLMKT